MSAGGQSPPNLAGAPGPLWSVLRAVAHHRGVRIAVASWLVGYLVVLFSYLGPGMIKSVLTLRTGNAWVHALGYHAVAPHVIADAPLVVRIFGIR